MTGDLPTDIFTVFLLVCNVLLGVTLIIAAVDAMRTKEPK